MPESRALKLIDSSPQKRNPTYKFARSSASLSINGDPSHKQNTHPLGRTGGQQVSYQPKNRRFRSVSTTDFTTTARFLSRSILKWDLLKHLKQTNPATSRRGRRSQIMKGTRDEYEAIWRQDAKLVRVPKIDPSIQLSGGAPPGAKGGDRY